MKKTGIAVIWLSFIIALPGMVTAHHPESPTEIEGVRNVSAGEVKALLEREDVTLIDSRKAHYYAEGHISKAHSIPFKWTTFGEIQTREGEFDMSKLPPDKKAMIVFYSDGEHNWDAYHSSKDAASAGYENVMWFQGGLKSWTEQGYPLDK